MELDKAEIKKVIVKELAKVKKDIEVLKDLTQPISPENAIGRVSRMDAINNKSINEASLRQSEEKLRKLKAAFASIDDKHFGICIKCNQSIPLGRIMLIPQANKCVNCA